MIKQQVIKEGHEIYGHLAFMDSTISKIKSDYRKLRETHKSHNEAVQILAKCTPYKFECIQSMVRKSKLADLKANKKEDVVEMTTKERVHKCYDEMVEINRPDVEQRHLIADVADRMRMDHSDVFKIIEEGIQLTLF